MSYEEEFVKQTEVIRKIDKALGGSGIAITLAIYNVERLYKEKLISTEHPDWNLIFLVVYWVCNKYLCDRGFLVTILIPYLQHVKKNKKRTLLRAEREILRLLDFNFHRHIITTDTAFHCNIDLS